MSAVSDLFDASDSVEKGVRSLGDSILQLSDYIATSSPLELAESKVVGKRIARSCDDLLNTVEEARKKVGALMLHHTHVKTKKGDALLHDVENDLSLLHSDLTIISSIAEKFFESEKRDLAFKNISQAFGKLVQHATVLLWDENALKNVKKIIA